MRNNAQQIILLLFLLVGGVLFYLGYNSPYPEMAFTEEREYWNKKIENLGAHRAYDELGKVVQKSSALRQHLKAHVFGEALYTREGIGGLSVCDSRFQNGCFHEMIEWAIAEHGTGILKNLNTICQNTIRHEQGCEHGAGHGILAYTGYEEDDLKKALTLCDEFGLQSPIGGCYQGVFMEFGRRDALIGQKMISVAYNPFDGNALYPCNKVDERYRDSCVFFQPEYWQKFFFNNKLTSDTIKQTGVWCATKAAPHQIPCFQGMGDVAMEGANFDTRIAMSFCDASSLNIDYRLACRIQGFIIKGVLEGVTSRDSIEICRGLTKPAQETCSRHVSKIMAELRKNPN